MFKRLLLLMFFLSFLFIFSCSREHILGTVDPWYGHLYDAFNKNKADIFVDFGSGDLVSVEIKLYYNKTSRYRIKIKDGSYYISPNNYMEMKFPQIDLWDKSWSESHHYDENSGDRGLWEQIADSLDLEDKEFDNYHTVKLKLEMTGYWYQDNNMDNNTGKYELTFIFKKEDGSSFTKTVKDDWELHRNP